MATALDTLPDLVHSYAVRISGRRHLNIRGTGSCVLADGEDAVHGLIGLVYQWGRLVGALGQATLYVGDRVINVGDLYHVGPEDRVTVAATGDYQLFILEGHH